MKRLVSEDSAPEAESERSLIASGEEKIIEEFAERLKQYEIYQVSELLTIMEELDKLGLESRWKDEIKAAINFGNGEMYQKLVNTSLES